MYSPQDARVLQEFYQNQILEVASFNLATLRNPLINGFAQYIYQQKNLLCYKGGILGHVFLEYNTNITLFQAKSSYLRNLCQQPAINRKFDFPIPSQAQNGQKSIRDQQ